MVFNNAFEAAVDNIWHSSITYTFHLAWAGANLAFSIISLIFSTPVLDAASISIMSKAIPSDMLLQSSHESHGSGFGSLYFWQFNDLANILALDVFPVPRGPQNK